MDREILHMCKVLRNDQSVIAEERFARCFDAAFAVRGEREVGRAGVPAVQGPFCFAMTDDEAPGGGGHFVQRFCIFDLGDAGDAGRYLRLYGVDKAGMLDFTVRWGLLRH